MGIVVNDAGIEKALEAALEERRKKVQKVFMYVGERCVAKARTAHKYKDRTGNLTSSIGYVVVQDGVIIKSSTFNQVAGSEGKAAKGKVGKKSGQAYAEYLARKYNKGLVLIIVAGMEYAYYVNKKGLNVTDSAELLGEILIPSLLSKLK